MKIEQYSICLLYTSLSDPAQEEGTGLTKASAVLDCSAITSNAVQDFAVKIVGCNTGYSGAIYLDNVTFLRDESSEEDTSVDSTLVPNLGNTVISEGNTPVSYTHLFFTMGLKRKSAEKSLPEGFKRIRFWKCSMRCQCRRVMFSSLSCLLYTSRCV